MYPFPWEVQQKDINQFFEGPFLFAALYRVYRGAYFGQGFKFCGTHFKFDSNLQNKFDQLPIDIKRIILAKIWDNGIRFNALIVFKGELFLQSNLHFLFAQYGRLKNLTSPIISKGCGAWNGYKLDTKTYIFKYGPQKLDSQVLIPDFLSRESDKPISIAFGLLCL
jgi:hypothetical protein